MKNIDGIPTDHEIADRTGGMFMNNPSLDLRSIVAGYAAAIHPEKTVKKNREWIDRIVSLSMVALKADHGAADEVTRRSLEAISRMEHVGKMAREDKFNDGTPWFQDTANDVTDGPGS